MKRRDWRRAAGITAIPLLLVLSVSSAYAGTSSTGGDGVSLAGMVVPGYPVSAAQTAPGACNDSAYSLLGGKWKQTLNWRYQSSSTPGDMNGSKVLNVIKRSFDNITGARNDCGLADNVSATSHYLGTTSAKPNVNKRGRCSARDDQNVVGFGPLPPGILAVTCIRYGSNNSITEADIRINTEYDWVLTVGACHFWQELLEPTLTHEIGHMFGLGHVGERKHGRLTMSTTSDGPCSNAETTLGRGDVRGLRHLYPL
ncbi:MAG TPA: hypothetical protein VIF08_04600 [Candidatus Limnocylindrales bacterium]